MAAIWPYSYADMVKHNIRTTTGFSPGKHDALDKAPADQAKGIVLLASQDGTLQTGTEPNGGKWTYILGSDGKGYGNDHCERFLKTAGVVKKGEPIAIMGMTGHATGIHTHFWVRQKYGVPTSYVNPDSQGLTYFDQEETPMAVFDFSLKEVGRDIHLVMNQPATGGVTVKDGVTGEITDPGVNILFGTDKIVSPNHSKRLYVVTFNGVTHQIDFRDAPAPTPTPTPTPTVDPKDAQIAQLTQERDAARVALSKIQLISTSY